ncbi:hypothetical protein WG78_05840 [Amantichitinum ursilacus]|uniref:Uncharacterized protein n=1 Tax=Amantichitinum ursilacus TaxID=857265 RepID=A0A0N1JTA1_9NEIS|nr:hypothetical protein WG78_05840 [Amantichitinum ursilacus]
MILIKKKDFINQEILRRDKGSIRPNKSGYKWNRAIRLYPTIRRAANGDDYHTGLRQSGSRRLSIQRLKPAFHQAILNRARPRPDRPARDHLPAVLMGFAGFTADAVTAPAAGSRPVMNTRCGNLKPFSCSSSSGPSPA